MSLNKQFEVDYQATLNSFPKLKKPFWNPKIKCWIVDGELDICDTLGVYWDSYEIRIVLPNTYPYCVPIVIERSKKIPRGDDRHIDEYGICCLDITHRLLLMSRRGIRLSDFIANKIYPYFANQIYFEFEKNYAGSEYKHHFGGVKQFYAEDLEITNNEDIVLILRYVLSEVLPARNDSCFCGSKLKYKYCHLELVETLRKIGKKQLVLDLVEFEKEIIQL